MAAAAIAAAAMWVYALLLLFPAIDPARAATVPVVGPYRSDIYPRWLGARVLLWEGRDPYSPAVIEDIQRGFYGRVLAPDDPIKDQIGFTYPLYIIFLLAPLTPFSFDLLLPLFYGIILVLIGLSTLGWLAGLGWRLQRADQAALVLLGCSTATALIVAYVQQPVVFAVAALAGAAACLARGARAERPDGWRNGWSLAGGALLAVATIKPQLSLPMIGWLLAWAVVDAQRRGGVALGFAGGLGLLAGAGLLLLPTWPAEWLAAVRDYEEYALGGSPLGTGTPSLLTGAVTALVGLVLAGYLWRTRRAAPGSRAFSLGLALTGLYSLVLFPAWTFYHQLILYPAALLVLQEGAALRATGGAGTLAYRLSLAALALPWVLATGLIVVWGAATPVGAGAVPAGGWPWPWIIGFAGPLLLIVPLGLLVRLELRGAPAPACPPEEPVHA